MFKEGDFALIKDNKGKKYIIKLEKDKFFEFHLGKISHNDIINKNEGIILKTSKNQKITVFKPTLWEFILRKLKRSSQIIYPKDIGQILILGDIKPGLKILECGTGSGALTIYLINFLKDTGFIYSIDEKENMIETARENIENYFGLKIEDIKNLKLENKNLQDIEEKNFDRVIIDLVDPWNYLTKIWEIMNDEGLFICWLPNSIQVFNLIDEIENKFKDKFHLEIICETLQREWQKKEKSLRPKDLMVAHTGFLLVFRKLNNSNF